MWTLLLKAGSPYSIRLLVTIHKEVKMGAKEFYTAIDMLDTYNRIMNIPHEKPIGENVRISTRELGRYRSYIYREKMLKREILELTQSRMRIEKMAKQEGLLPEAIARGEFKRGRSKMIDLWLELSKVCLKRRNLEMQLDQIQSPFIRKVVLHRYFTDDSQRLHSWAQTAQELELPMTGVELRKTVVRALEFGKM